MAEARRLLAEAGYPNGEGFPELEMVSQGGVADEAFIDMMKRNLNIDIRLNAVERGPGSGSPRRGLRDSPLPRLDKPPSQPHPVPENDVCDRRVSELGRLLKP